MITLYQILQYKIKHKVSRISITKRNSVKLYYSDCSSTYVSLNKFMEMVSSDE